MKRTIYVKDDARWSELKAEAEAAGISMSEYLMGSKGPPGQLDRIETKLDELLEGIKPTQTEKPHKSQAELDFARRVGQIKRGKSAAQKTKPDDHEWFGGYSKTRQIKGL